MDRQIIDYLPPVLQKVMEFMAITSAQQPEIESAWGALDLVMNNQFIDTATEEGVAVWENELNITPLNTDTLEERKQRIKTAWVYGAVYTYNWLADWLKTSCGADNPSPNINDYVLRATLPVSVDYLRILDDMRRYVSANMLIDPLILLTKLRWPQYAGMAYRFGVKQTMQGTYWDMTNINMLADEIGQVIMEGPENKILYEEITV